MKEKRVCSSCKEEKNLSEFSPQNKKRTIFDNRCKKCNSNRARNYRKTKDGLISLIYCNQITNSKSRGMNPPTYSHEDFKKWILAKDVFHTLYNTWKLSGYDKNLVPSCDRIDNDLSYSFDNINIVPFIENKKRADREIRECILIHGNKPQRKVVAINRDSGDVFEFLSVTNAERFTNIDHSNISAVCRHKNKYAKNWIFYYKEEYDKIIANGRKKD